MRFLAARPHAHGFTLVELVCVIVILSVMAATATPKFVEMATAARVATVKAGYGAVSGAALLAGMQCRSTPGCYVENGPGVNTPGPDGLSKQMYYGYPTGTSGPYKYGIRDWIQVDGLTVAEPNFHETDFSSDSAPDPTNCKVNYHEATGSPPQPTITMLTSGC